MTTIKYIVIKQVVKKGQFKINLVVFRVYIKKIIVWFISSLFYTLLCPS